MPAEDVSDLRDVFDAINKLCETMKTSHYEDESDLEPARTPSAAPSSFVSAEDLSVQRMETQRQKWRDSQASLAGAERWSDACPEMDASCPEMDASCPELDVSCPELDASCAEMDGSCPELVASPAGADAAWASSPPGAEDASDLEAEYHTASSEPSLSEGEAARGVAGHVAAMRERFESLTRAPSPPEPAPAARAPEPEPY